MFETQTLLIGMAVFIVVTNLPGLLAPKAYRKAMKSYLSDQDHIRSGGLFMLLMSFMFLATKWDFTYEWNSLVSILGWSIFIKALIWLWSPEFVKKNHKELRTKSNELTITTAIVAILVAVFLAYAAIDLV